jgi:hypothetical protein
MKVKIETLKLFSSILREMSANKSVTIINSSEIEPLPKDQADSLMEELNNSAFANYIDLFEGYINYPMNLAIQWEYKLRTEYEMGGHISMHNLALVMLDDKYKLIEHGIKNDETKKMLKYAKYLDKDIESGENFGTVIYINEALKQFDIGIILEGVFYRMDLSLEQYIRYAALTKGFIYWQCLFCKGLSIELKNDMRENYFKRMIADLPVLFPSEDYSDLEKSVNSF